MTARTNATLLLGILALVAVVSTTEAGRLDLRDGGTLTDTGIRYRDRVFHLNADDADKSVPRAEVADWWVNESAQETAPDTAGDEGRHARVRERLLEARERGLQFAERHPGSKGIIVEDLGRFSLTDDHRTVYRYHFIGLMLSEEALEWARLQLGFTQGRSRQTVIGARCLTSDGKLNVLRREDINTGVAGRGSVYFDPNARRLSASIPGAEVGGVVEYIYEYEAYNTEDWRLFSPGFFFQMDEPCLRSRLEVRVPQDQDLYWWAENWNAAGETVATGRVDQDDDADGGKLYAWEKTRVPPVVEEPLMAPRNEVVPSVHASLFRNWDYLEDLIGGMQKERMVATDAVRRKAAEIVEGLEEPAEKMAALYHWVQKNVRYISIKGSLSSGWSGHPAAETLEQGYGDCTDKSILLCTLLRTCGFDAQPIVVRTNDRGDLDPPYPYLACNHAITVTELDGQVLYIDSTTQDHRFPALRSDSHGVVAYNFIKGTRNRIPVPHGKRADAKWSRQTMTLDGDGTLLCDSRNRYAGRYEAGLRGYWKQIPEPMKGPLMQQYLNSIASGAQLVDFDLTDAQDLDTPFEMQFSYRLPEYVERSGSTWVLQLPDREQSFGELAVDDREYPIVYTTTRFREWRIGLSIPDSLELVALPQNALVESPYLRYRESFRVHEGVVRAEITFEIKKRRVPTEDCPVYLSNLRRIVALSQRPLYFSPVEPPPPQEALP